MSAAEIRRRRLLYRAGHRGTKEMDWLLGRYVAAALPAVDDAGLDRIERLSDIADPRLLRWILHPETLDEQEFAGLVGALRRFHKLDDPAA
ncbi:MAG: succinate dehydrogenase assembly factor 2 [Hyphomicrobiaceae bacterium]